MSQLARAIQVTAAVSGGEAAARLLQAAAFIILARKVGEQGLGAWSYAAAVGAYAVMMVEFGFDSYAIRRVIVRPLDAMTLLSNLCGLRAAIAAPICAATAGYALLTGLGHAQDTLIVLAVLACPAVALSSRWKLLADQRSGALVVSSVLSNLVFLLAALCIRDVSQILWLAAAKTLGEYSAALYTYEVVAGDHGRFRPAFDRVQWRALWDGSLPFGLTRAAGESLNHIDIVLLGILTDSLSVGRYAVAYRFLLFAYLGLAGIQAGLYPILSNYSGGLLKNRSSLRLLQVYTAAAVICVSAAAAIIYRFSNDLILILFGQEFADSAAVLQVLCAALPLACWRVIAREALRAQGQERIETAGVIGTSVLKAAACFLLIPHFGLMACAWVTVLTEFLLGAYCSASLWKGRRKEQASANP
jgi:O-antigen/teichoic acid export membrane protein